MKKFIVLQFLLVCLIISGFGQWPTDPMLNLAVSNAAGEQAIPKVATSVNGITYIAWFSNTTGNYNVMLQKLDIYGNIQWAENGLLVSDHEAMTWLTDWDMTVDHTDCAILTFQDIRNVNNDVFAYRISPEGEFLWGADGIEMSTGAAFDVAPKVCVTEANNACFAWQADDVVILQKISPEGNKLWGESGITLSGTNTYSWPQLLPVNNDEIILKYFEDSGPAWSPTRHVFAQRFDADGNPVWADDVVISNAGGISAWTQVFPFINDGNNGFIIAWHDDRDNNNLSSTFVQHVGFNGEILLGDDGTEASIMMGRHNFYPQLALPPGSEDIFVFWNEMDGDQNNRGIYGQKISAAGDRVWTDNGKSIIEISSTNVYPISASQSETDLIVFYEEYIDVMNAKIKAMCLDTDGEFVWTEEKIDMCSVSSAKVHSVAGNLNSGQWISTWEDDRNGAKDIYAQNIQLDGTLGAIELTGGIDIEPDTLFIDENYSSNYIYLNNNSNADYTITGIEENAYWWDFEDLPEFPYTILPNESLTLLIPLVVNPWDVFYLFDSAFIYSTIDTNKYMIGLNFDIFYGVDTHSLSIDLYPNPSKSSVKFEFKSLLTNHGMLNISDQSGRVVKQFNIDGKSSVIWDGKDENNHKVKPGTYFYQIISDEILETGKLIIME